MGALLYYPFVVPPPEVIYQSLLYWDGFASVVPQEKRFYDRAVPAPLKELGERGLYRPLTVRTPLYGADWRSTWAKALSSQLRRMAVQPGVRTEPAFHMWPTKLPNRIERELLRLRLATWPDDSGPIVVPRPVGELIIATLAREIAVDLEERADGALYPYTDSPTARRQTMHMTVRGDREAAWEVELGRVLPTPAPTTSLSDVLAFRERHADERARLMRAVHRLLGDLRRDYEHPSDVITELRRELDEAAKEHRSAGRAAGIAWASRSVAATVGVAAAALGALVVPDVGWLMGAVSGYAINIATREIRPMLAYRPERDDFSYLHKVRKELQ